MTAAEQVGACIRRLRERGTRVVIAKAQLPLREAARSLGLREALAPGTCYPKLSDAVADFERAAAARG